MKPEAQDTHGPVISVVDLNVPTLHGLQSTGEVVAEKYPAAHPHKNDPTVLMQAEFAYTHLGPAPMLSPHSFISTQLSPLDTNPALH